jgi:hypothetical protein
MSNFSVPFSVYDFFGYLSAGFVVLLSYAYSFPPKGHTFGIIWTVAPKGARSLIWFLIAATLAYILGHIVASSGGWLVQRGSDSLLGRPAEILLRDPRTDLNMWQRLVHLFSEYYAPLDPKLRTVIRGRLAMYDSGGSGDRTVFSLVEACMRRDDKAFAFCDRCAALYAFCRNVAVALVVAAVMLAAGRGDNRQLLCVAALVAAAFLLLRYLKFYRLYTMLVYTSYVSRGL